MTDESPESPKTAAPTLQVRCDPMVTDRSDRRCRNACLIRFALSAWFGAGSLLFHVTVDGLWHGYMYITLLVSLAILGYLAMLAGLESLPSGCR